MFHLFFLIIWGCLVFFICLVSPLCSNASPFCPNWLVTFSKKIQNSRNITKSQTPIPQFLSQFDLISRPVLSPLLSFSIESSVLKSTPNTIPEPTINILDALHYSTTPRTRSCYSWPLLVTTITSLNLSCSTANHPTSLTVSRLFRFTTSIIVTRSPTLDSNFHGTWLHLWRKHL